MDPVCLYLTVIVLPLILGDFQFDTGDDSGGDRRTEGNGTEPIADGQLFCRHYVGSVT